MFKIQYTVGTRTSQTVGGTYSVRITPVVYLLGAAHTTALEPGVKPTGNTVLVILKTIKQKQKLSVAFFILWDLFCSIHVHAYTQYACHFEFIGISPIGH